MDKKEMNQEQILEAEHTISEEEKEIAEIEKRCNALRNSIEEIHIELLADSDKLYRSSYENNDVSKTAENDKNRNTYCPRCGNYVDEDIFCRKCGTKVK